MAKKVRSFILPFAVAGKDRLNPFTKDMEMAAVFYLAESDRKKGEGMLLKKPEEKLAFIAETCYPIWLTPWKGMTLILDGLEFTNQQISYDEIPDIKAFDTDIQASSKSREAYLVALSQNTSYFQNFVGAEERTIEGLVTDPNFKQDLMDYLSEGEDMGNVETAKAVLSPMLDESEVSESIAKLSELRDLNENELNALSKSMKLLSKATHEQMKALQTETKNAVKEFDKKIEKLKPKVDAKTAKIKDKRDEEVTRISKNYSRKLSTLNRNKVKLEKMIERLNGQIERVEADIKLSRENKDEAAEFQLKQKLDEVKKKLSPLDKELKTADREIENTETAKVNEISEARAQSDARIEEAMQVLLDLEAEKEARIRMDQQELDSLEEKTSSIIQQIGVMVEAKEDALNEIDSMGVEEKRKNPELVYIPLYFVCYKTDSGKRYVVYPPSLIGAMGIKTKLRSVFGSRKMKSFLHSRSQAIADLLDRLIDLTEGNPLFEKEITAAANNANILGSKELQLGVKKGLTELRDERWISENEFDDLNQQIP